jgi:hypothetical protein
MTRVVSQHHKKNYHKICSLCLKFCCYIYSTLHFIEYRYISKPKPFDVFWQYTAYREINLTIIQIFFLNIESFMFPFCW